MSERSELQRDGAWLDAQRRAAHWCTTGRQWASLHAEMVHQCSWEPDKDALRDRVAVVAGATRGAGRGIATALGEAGATVVCTGRQHRIGAASEYDRPETIDETAELVSRLGGTGIAVAVDHLDSDQVRALAERIGDDHGHIDILVNDIWGGELLKGGRSGTRRSGSSISPTDSGSCGWRSRPT